MSRATYPLKLPHSVKKAAQRLAKEDGVSLNQWIAATVAEKVGVVETAAAFFKKRAGNAKGDRLLKFLRQAPQLPGRTGRQNGLAVVAYLRRAAVRRLLQLRVFLFGVPQDRDIRVGVFAECDEVLIAVRALA